MYYTWGEFMKDKAMRFNTDKPKYSMMDLTCLEPGTRVLEFGAKKYARDNWRKGLPFSEILDSLMRHISALQRGEFVDPESELTHIGHIQANAMFLGNKANINDIEEPKVKLSKAELQFFKWHEAFAASKKLSLDDSLGFIDNEPYDDIGQLLKAGKYLGVCGHKTRSTDNAD